MLAALDDGSADVARAQVRLRQAVDRAVTRGAVLRLIIDDALGGSSYLFVNTPEGRRAVREVQGGELELDTRGPCCPNRSSTPSAPTSTPCMSRTSACCSR